MLPVLRFMPANGLVKFSPLFSILFVKESVHLLALGGVNSPIVAATSFWMAPAAVSPNVIGVGIVRIRRKQFQAHFVLSLWDKGNFVPARIKQGFAFLSPAKSI